jgi:putative peptide zinc metalloprotease protein
MVAVSTTKRSDSARTAAPERSNLGEEQLRLKPHVDGYRHVYQGEVWYVFHDRAAHRYYRVSGAGAEIVGALDGRRGLQEVLSVIAARDPDCAPDPQQALQFIHQLHSLDLLQTNEIPDVARLDKRRDTMARRRLVSALRSPLSLKVKLLDPTDIITWLLPRLGWVFGPMGMVLWLAVVTVGAVIGLMNWDDLTRDVGDRLLTVENLAVIGAIYPIVKALHELGHGLALRRLGGEVREIGVLFAAFIPVPYVDASSAAVLERRRDRMMVGAAGIYVEMFIGSIALIIWSQSEASAVRAICYNIIMISGFSTLLFNGNPLQRYDGYYILTDMLGIPGLGTRSTQYLAGLFRRYVLGDATAAIPEVTRAERWWFIFYGPASFIYRLSLMLLISFYVAEQYPGLGLLLGAWSVLGYFAMPLWGLGGMVGKGKPSAVRRSLLGLGGVVLAAVVLFLVIPVPRAVIAQGVVMMPDEAVVRAQVSGVMQEMLAVPGSDVRKGQPIARLSEPMLESRAAQADARLAELLARQLEARANDAGRAAAILEQIAHITREREEAYREVASLTILSPSDGKLLVARSEDLPGHYVMHGEGIATVWDPARAVIRTMTSASDIAEIRATLTDGADIKASHDIDIRLPWDVMQRRPARVISLVPGANDKLPNAVLSVEGGGPFAVTRDRDSQFRVQEALFQVVLQGREPLPVECLDARVYVRFALDAEPIGVQMWHGLRLMFLRRLHA